MAEGPTSTQPPSQPAAVPDSAPGRPDPDRRRTGRPGRKRWRRIAFIVLPILIIGGLLYYWFFMRPYESTDDAFIDTHVTPIAPRIAGQVTALLVQDNQAVQEGQVLLEIDPRDYEAKLAEARAGLVAARTRSQQADAQLVLDQARVVQAKANLASAETESERAQADLKRYQSLESPAVSRSQLDLATTQARSNAAAVEVARSLVRAAEAQVQLGSAAIQTAAAEVQGNEAAVRQAELTLSYTKLLAPKPGFVAHRTVEAGTYVQTGQELMALVPPRVWVTANFKETQLSRMRPGQPVTIHVDAYPGHTFRGHVDSIQRGSGAQFSLLPPENATGNYVKVVQRVPVKIVFDEEPNPRLPLGPGMSVEPSVNILAKPNPGRQEASR